MPESITQAPEFCSLSAWSSAAPRELRLVLHASVSSLSPDAVCGVAYDFLRRRTPAFAEALHSPGGLKPVTAGVLETGTPGRYAMRLTALDRESALALAVLRETLRQSGAEGEILGRHRVFLATAGTEAAPSPDGPLPERFDTEFLTPTALKQGALHLPLPIPRELAANWLRRWNRHTGDPQPEEGAPPFLGWVDRHVAVSRYTLRTESLPLREGRLIGFVGKVRFTLPDAASRAAPEAALWHRLWRYSYWCGTGVKTLWGCGQTRPLQDPLPK